MPILHRTTVFLAAALLAGSAWAASPTRTDAELQVAAAVRHIHRVGAAQAIQDFNNASEWKAGCMNVVLEDMSGQVLASSLNGRLVGRQTLQLKDSAGQDYVKAMVSAAQHGGGWVDFQYFNPETQALESRSMFVRPTDARDGFVGIAIVK